MEDMGGVDRKGKGATQNSKFVFFSAFVELSRGHLYLEADQSLCLN